MRRIKCMIEKDKQSERNGTKDKRKTSEKKT